MPRWLSRFDAKRSVSPSGDQAGVSSVDSAGWTGTGSPPAGSTSMFSLVVPVRSTANAIFEGRGSSAGEQPETVRRNAAAETQRRRADPLFGTPPDRKSSLRLRVSAAVFRHILGRQLQERLHRLFGA